jgi:hypothetical protein
VRISKHQLTVVGSIGSLVVVISIVLPILGLSSSTTTSNAPTNQTQNVNVVNTPTVDAVQTGTWSVGITGTPSVNVNVSQTELVYDQTLTVQAGGLDSMPPLDVSRFKEIRVVTNVNGDVGYGVDVRLINPNNVNEVMILARLNQSHSGSDTSIIDLPGQSIDFFIIGSFTGASSVHVQAYGRIN